MTNLERTLNFSMLVVAIFAMGAAPAPTTAPSRAAEDLGGKNLIEKAWQQGMHSLRRDVLRAPFTTDLTIGQAVDRLKLAEKLDQSIQSAEQPGGPRWREATCEVRIELPGTAVADLLENAGSNQAQQLGLSKEAFGRKIAHLRTQRFVAIGIGSPSRERPDAPGDQAMKLSDLIPVDPPDWIARQMDADGKSAGSGLKGARAAEAMALSQMRQQIEALVLSPDMTIQQAIRKDARVGEALGDAVRRARVSRVDYGDEIVAVRVSLDLDYVWQALSSLR